MFTGIIEAACQVAAVRQRSGSLRLTLDLGPLREAPSAGPPLVAPGDSVAVHGVCLTVAALLGDQAEFDVVAETLALTNLGALAPGRRVNVERALRLGERLDGHLVQGHVETTGTVIALEPQTGQAWLSVSCPAALVAEILPKGSITVDGVSLTVADLADDRFSVALVPHTLAHTTLGAARPGERVNIEPDMIGRWVRRLLPRS